MALTVSNSSAAIHDYRGKIAHAIDELKDQLTKTERAIETVSEDWKDDNFKQFQNNFDEDKEKIKPLCDKLYDYENNLLYQLEIKLKAYEESIMSLN